MSLFDLLLQVKICGPGGNPLCCVTSYEYSQTETDGKFSLGVFEGIHYRDGSVRESMGFGICTILKCNSETSNLCDSHVCVICIMNEFFEYPILIQTTSRNSFLIMISFCRTIYQPEYPIHTSIDLSFQEILMPIYLCFLNPCSRNYNLCHNWKKFCLTGG